MARFRPGFDEILVFFNSVPYSALPLYELPHLHSSFTRQPHKIHAAVQSADINSGGLFGDFLLQELLTFNIYY